MATAAPTSFAKSTCASVGYPIWLALYYRIGILLLSNTGALAEHWVEDYHRPALDSDPAILQDFGPQRTATWRQDHLVLSNGSVIMAKGQGYQLRGWRPDVIIADDLENEEAVASAEQRKKLAFWFDTTLTNRLGPKGQLAVVGTIQHEQSLLADLMNRPGWDSRRFKALNVDENGQETSLWPAMWSVEQLKQRRAEIGTTAFSQDFQNEPWVETARCFPREWFAETWVDWVPDGCDWFAGFDPSIGEKEVSDPSAIFEFALHRPTGHIYAVSGEEGHWSSIQQAQRLLAAHHMHTMERMGVENNAYQDALVQWTRYLGRENKMLIPVVGIPASRDKVKRARSVSHLCENGRFHWVRGNESAFNILTQFPQGVSDHIVDAFVMGLKAMMQCHQFGYPVKPPPTAKKSADHWRRVTFPKSGLLTFGGLWPDVTKN